MPLCFRCISPLLRLPVTAENAPNQRETARLEEVTDAASSLTTIDSPLHT